MAFGEKAETEARLSIESLRMHNAHPVHIVSEGEGETDKQRSRWAKTNLDRLSPFDLTCYLDADTRVYGDLSAGFRLLEDGWEFVICPSENQGADFLWHVSPDERGATRKETGNPDLLALQGGVFFFRKCGPVRTFFKAWRAEWARWSDEDQAALLRALHKWPVKTWLLGRPYNGGALMGHRFGACRV